MRNLIMAVSFTVFASAAIVSAQPAGTAPAQHHAHVHSAPHGGTLIALSDEFLNFELVLDSQEGKLTGYILDDHAENPVRVAQKEVRIDLSSIGGKASTGTLTLKAVENALTGEKAGNSSEFSGSASILKGATKFKGAVREVTAKGSTFKKVPVTFP